jgi:hypothetical protein
MDGNATYAAGSEESLKANYFLSNESVHGAAVDFSEAEYDVYADLTGSVETPFTDNNSATYQNISKVKGGKGKNVLIGSMEFDSTLQAGVGESTIVGSFNDDLLLGNSSNTVGSVFYFATGGGKDTISGFGYGTDTVDLDQLAAEAGNSDMTSADLDKNGNLIVGFGNGGDSLTVVNAENKVINASANGQDWVVKFGTDLTYSAGVNMMGNANKDGNKLTLTNSDVNADEVHIYMNDFNYEGDKDDTWYLNVDKIDASAYTGNASIIGADGRNNDIIAGTGKSSLWGGFGGNDTINVTNGNAEVFYLKDDGNDVINGAGAGDTINLFNISLDDIANADITQSNNKIVAKFSDDSTLTVNGSINNVSFKVGNDSDNVWKRRTNGTWYKA